jgi:hypothetical protein
MDAWPGAKRPLFSDDHFRVTGNPYRTAVAKSNPQEAKRPSSLRVILHNDRYRGFLISGKTKKVRSADNGRKLVRPRAQSEWVMQGVPEQRIVSDELCDTWVQNGRWNVPGGRVELPTPAFSGPRSTGELPRHRKNSKIVAARSCDVEGQSARAAVPVESVGMMSSYFRDSSNSRIQSFFLSTSRGLVPSAGPTIPSFSMMSISRAARP